MPHIMKDIKDGTLLHSINISYELLAASWFMQEGWEVFLPLIDHGQKTDLMISDSQRHYRIQVKTISSSVDDIENRWKGIRIDYVVVFVRNHGEGGEFSGYVMPAFQEGTRKLGHDEHFAFNSKSQFLKAFRKLPFP